MEDKKPRINPYQALIDAYEQELLTIDGDNCPNIYSQIKIEIRRLREGIIDTIDLLSNKKVKLRAKIDFPVEQYPNVNFPGKIIGPAGKTLKDLQEKTETRMSVLGAGSTRNQSKEMELVQSGDPKFQHLNERMHLQVDCLGTPFETYEKISKALIEIKKIITPNPEELVPVVPPFSWNEICFQQQSIGRGHGVMSYGPQFSSGYYNIGSGYRGSQNSGVMSIDKNIMFNGVNSFGMKYEQAEVTSKIPIGSQRFGASEPYPQLGNYRDFKG